MANKPKFQRPPHIGQGGTLSARMMRAPATARFLKNAAPAFFRELSKEYKRETVAPCLHPEPKRWPNRGLYAAWIGHSTVLLKADGFTIVTDPVFSLRVGINLGPLTVGIKRLIEPATAISSLPAVDLILVSHAHMDHFDIPSLRQLEGPRTHVITAYRTADLLRARRYAGVHELRWEATVDVGPAHVRAFQVAHWGARMRSDVYRGFNGYLVDAGRYRFVFGGDTAYTESFKKLRSSRPIDLAIMPIGAYDPWIRVHCNPEQALRMAEDAGAERILPVHHQTFQLSREPALEPIERLLRAAGNSPERVALKQIGEEFHL